MRDRAEHLLDLGRVVDAADDDRALVARRGLDREPLADRHVVVVGVGLRHERAVGAELGDGGVGAVGPVERVEARDRRRVDAGDVLLLAGHERLVDADVGGGVHAGHARERVALGGLERHAVGAVDDVGGRDLVGDGRLDRVAQCRRPAPRRR